jgi:RNA-directed DNA polymerase
MRARAHNGSHITRRVGILCGPLSSMRANYFIARALAAAFCASRFDVDESVACGARLLGQRWRWLRPLVRRTGAAFATVSLPSDSAVTDFICADRGFQRACRKHDLQLTGLTATPPRMNPVTAASSWDVPAITTPGELADWFGIELGELDWFADRKGLETKRASERLRHYRYRLLAKRFATVRIIEAPKARLKELQRRVLAGILDHIPPHPAAHGFRRGRSIKTFAEPHVRKQVVLRLDLENFFPSIEVSRVQALFSTAGYPRAVAELLTGICTNATPLEVWEAAATQAGGRHENSRLLYVRPHLPQGAPTSPYLANLCAYRLDCRLAALASSVGAAYTRYADDLAFSGNRAFARGVKRFYLHVCATVMEEGFAVHFRKTKIMRQGVRQRLAGVVINEHLNVVRADFDHLKATLTNCVRHGTATQNRTGHNDFAAHLLGRISFVEMINPARGRKLRELFERIKS